MDKGILIPRKGMAEVIRFLAEEEKVSLGLGKQSLALKADDRYLFIRLLTDKKFPDYRRIIPESFSYRFAINRRVLFDTIRRIALLSTERFKGVILSSCPTTWKSPSTIRRWAKAGKWWACSWSRATPGPPHGDRL